MLRHRSRVGLAASTSGAGWVACAVLFAAVSADAAPAAPSVSATSDGLAGRRLAIDTPLHMYATPSAPVSPTIYLERCKGGCLIHKGATNDARTNTSTIPAQDSPIGEFANSLGQIGTAADAEWGQVVQCMKEVYSPYNVAVTDVKPTSGAYHEALIAGLPTDIGQSNDILGLAPLASDCSAIDNVISFTFANRHPPAARVLNICWTASQESAHAFGLDHEYQFVAGSTSACKDPMTYRTDCGGEKFFRNEPADCGETATRPCKCGATQNSHQKLLSVFGAGTPITGNPTVTLTSPLASGGGLGRSVTVSAGCKRGVAHVDLLLNGYKWVDQPGASFGLSGQADPSAYAIAVPTALPDSIIDVQVVAYDDLDAKTESPVVTVTKGAPCASAATCAKGQKCEAGKCFWDPPAGEIGDSCAYPQFCQSGLCTGTKDQQICTQSCIPGVADGCPAGFSCVMSSATDGVCFFSSSGGCCSVDRSGQGWLVPGGTAAILLGLVRRRRRRR